MFEIEEREGNDTKELRNLLREKNKNKINREDCLFSNLDKYLLKCMGQDFIIYS